MTESLERRGWLPTGLFEKVTTVIMVVAACTLVWQRWSDGHDTPPNRARPPTAPLRLNDAPSKGAQTAKIAIVEYSDFECPFCGAVARDTLKALERTYVDSGRIRIFFKHFPLDKHKEARPAAIAAVCAGRQGKFWELHDTLFGNQPRLSEGGLSSLVASVKLDMSSFDECQRSEAAAAIVAADLAEGQKLRVSGTPTFYIGTVLPSNEVSVSHVLVGNSPVQQFIDILNGLLAAQ